MPNEYRNESRRRPPTEKYGTPGTQYPTPNPYDVVITEEVTSRAQAFEPVVYGSPHPVVSSAVLCHQSPVKSGNTDKAPVRIYANPRLAQEPYNLVNGDDEANDPSFPTFVRSYLLPRGYTPATMGSALTALIRLTLISGGSGYTPAAGSTKIPLVFTGGSGSGAAGYGEVVGGVIVAVVLTNGGSYTSAPTVSAAGGTGLSVTAVLQPASARLMSQVEAPAEEPFGGWFVRVTRTWTTLPGPVFTSKVYDPESKSIITETRQMVAIGTADPTLDAYTTDFRSIPVNSVAKQHVLRKYPTSITSKTIVTYEPDNHTYPAIMSGYSLATLTKLDGSKVARITPLIEAERPRQISKRITRTFTTSQPSAASVLSGIYKIEPVRHRYGGIFFNFETGPVLGNASEITYFSGTGDPEWGDGVVEGYELAASNPTATAYLASRTAGEWKLIHRDVRVIAEGVWMLVEVEIPIL